MNNPSFSIIIPTYNRAELIKKTIHSVLSQRFKNFELIIVDDGGVDNTKQIINEFNDERINYYWKENGERGAARNYGVQKASGDYINFIDSDDLVYSNHLKSAQKVIQEYEPDIFFFNYDILEKKSEKKMKNVLPQKMDANKKILNGNFISMNSIFLKRQVMLDFPFLENKNFVGGEDWLQWLKLSQRYNVKYNSLSTSCIIQHKERSVMNFDEKSFKYRTSILINELKKDEIFMRNKGTYLNKIQAHMLSYTSLHAALAGKYKIAISYLLSAIKTNPVEIFKLRTFAILKKLIFGLFSIFFLITQLIPFLYLSIS